MLIFVEVWTKQFKLTIINKALKIIKETFLISHKETTTFKCLEPNVKETELTSIDQNTYIDEFNEVKTAKEGKSNKHAQLNKDEAW